MDDQTFRMRVLEAAQGYRAAGRYAYYYARGKLAGDPLFRMLAEPGLIPDGARLCDLGCGRGLLLALLATGRAAPAAGPRSMTGIDHDRRGIALARRGCKAARFYRADLHQAPVPASDAVVLVDVLHYLRPAAQLALLARVRAALAPGGVLLLRVADAAQDLRRTLAVDRFGAWMRGLPAPPFHPRRLDDWLARLGDLGFVTETRAMTCGPRFPNVLVMARLRSD